MCHQLFSSAFILLLTGSAVLGAEIRIGIIGLDTSHVIAFTKVINDSSDPDHVPGGKVVAAFKGGSPDVPASATRVDKFTAELREHFQIQVVESIPSLCNLVDAILLESVDGRVHLSQVKDVFRARKPVFIDKPLTASYSDAREIARLGQESGTPWFSSSSLRFAAEYQQARADTALGGILGVESYGPASLEPTNPGLFWYGIHAVEGLYTMMGPGCESVSTASNKDFDVVVGVWADGRMGTVRGLRKGKEDYGLLLFGEKAVKCVPTLDVSYVPLVRQIIRFFQTGQPPVPNSETLEIMAFMDAAEQSRLHGGTPVKLEK
jgi:predicted dehydrogenase